MNYNDQYAYYRRAVEETLRCAVPADVPNPLGDAMRYSLLAGGKRLRPVLLLAAYAILQRDLTPALPFAAAVEMVHTYSLIHDDLPAMDNDDLRRGRPTCHKAYGEGMAVLAGDGLLSLAFETMAQSRHPRAFAALGELAARCGTRGMVAGQCADLTAEETGGNAELLRYIHLHKTADLLTAPLASGRRHFVGCCLSESMSRMSLIMYTSDERKQNAAKPARPLQNISRSKNRPLKKSGSSTRTFFK